MTNKTITLSRELAELCYRALNGGADQLTGMEHGRAFRELSGALAEPVPPVEPVQGHHPSCRAVDEYKPGDCSHYCKPVPPAGGEAEFPAYRDLESHPVADIEYQRDVGYNQALAETRPIVTRLQAELKQLTMVEYECRLALQVANKNTRQVIEQRDDLQSKLDNEAANHVGTLAEVQQLQSELTKALELLREASRAPEWSLSVDLQVRISNYLSNQSAPDDKGQGETVHECQKCWGRGVIPTRLSGEGETEYRNRCKVYAEQPVVGISDETGFKRVTSDWCERCDAVIQHETRCTGCRGSLSLKPRTPICCGSCPGGCVMGAKP